MHTAYASTLVADSPWTRLPAALRDRVSWTLWTLSEVGVLAGFFDARAWDALIAFSIVHAFVYTLLVGGKPMAFPAQLRIAYVGWLLIATRVPNMEWMMMVNACGLMANQLFGYCPLVRLLYLLPFNRNHPMTPKAFLKVFTTPPSPGRFRVQG
jgi:hypothetical protein